MSSLSWPRVSQAPHLVSSEDLQSISELLSLTPWATDETETLQVALTLGIFALQKWAQKRFPKNPDPSSPRVGLMVSMSDVGFHLFFGSAISIRLTKKGELVHSRAAKSKQPKTKKRRDKSLRVPRLRKDIYEKLKLELPQAVFLCKIGWHMWHGDFPHGEVLVIMKNWSV